MPSTLRARRPRPADPARWRAMFFLKVMLRRSKNRQTTLGTKRSPCVLNRWSAISASVISGVAPTRARISAAWLTSPVPTLHTRLTGAGAPPLAHQLDRCRRRHTEPTGGASTAHGLVLHGSNAAKTKIRRKRFGNAGWASITSPQHEYDLPRQGNPFQFHQRGKCSSARSPRAGRRRAIHRDL